MMKMTSTDVSFNRLVRYNSISRVKPEQLTIGEKYLLQKLERVQTRYGTSVVATIFVQETGSMILYLPRRFDQQLSNAAITEINNTGPYELEYLGPCSWDNGWRSHNYRLVYANK